MSQFSSIRGYIRDLNLAETTEDRQSLNNLGGAPIADDIALWVNNTKNETILAIREDEYDTGSDTINIDNQTIDEINQRSTVFTNGDKVSIRNNEGETIVSDLYVRKSDTLQTFQLSQTADLSSLFSLTVPPSNDDRYAFFIVRSDEITSENLQRLAVERSGVAVEIPGEDVVTDEQQAVGDIDDYKEEFDEIYQTIDIAGFRAQAKYVANESKFTDVRLRTEGGIVIADPSNMIVEEGIIDTSPGLYLSDPTSDVSDIKIIRAFSSSSNPWEDDNAGTLSTESADVTAGNLIINDSISFNNISSLPADGIVDSSAFTHKVRVTLNGVDYFLCLSSN